MNELLEKLRSVLSQLGFDNLCSGVSSENTSTYSNANMDKIQTGENEFFFIVAFENVCVADNTTYKTDNITKAERTLETIRINQEREYVEKQVIKCIRNYENTTLKVLEFEAQFDSNAKRRYDYLKLKLNGLNSQINNNQKVTIDNFPDDLITGEYKDIIQKFVAIRDGYPEHKYRPTETVKKLDLIEKFRRDIETRDYLAGKLGQDPFVQATAVGILAVGIGGASVVTEGLATSTDMIGVKIASNATYQLIVNEGDLKQIEVVSLGTAFFKSNVLKGSVPAMIQWRPFAEDENDIYKRLGDGIELNETIVNGTIGIGTQYGKQKTFNDWKSVFGGEKLKNAIIYINNDMLYRSGNKVVKDAVWDKKKSNE
jgi:hypothetical protein